MIEIDEVPADCNWIPEMFRRHDAGEALPAPALPGVVATALDPDVWAYSPNQPRKSDGKFGTGGGGYVQPKPTSRHPVLDESADRAGIGVDDLVHRRFDEEHAKGLASAIDRVDKAFPGSMKGSLLFTDEQAVLDSQFGKGTAAATSMNGKKILISDSANNVPAMYQPDGDHSHSAGGDTAEGVLTHELNHVALDLGGARYLSATAKGDAYDLAKTLPVPTKYAEGDRGDGRERAAELLTQAEFGQPSADAAGYFATVKDSYAKSPKRHTSATALDPDVWAYSPYQPRRPDGKFGRGSGSSGVGVGVSRERPELGGSDIHTYGDLEKARKNPVIAEAESTTPSYLGALGIHVTSSRQVAGVFEGGGEPSLMLRLDKGSSLEDADIGAAYMVRRNQQDSVITNVMGEDMDRLGLQPNGKLIRIEGLPTDKSSRERIFKEIQDSTPFASWDEKGGTVEVSYFDADLSRDTVRGLATFSAEHGGSMTLEPTHTRWSFHDDATRDGAREYLHPSDPGVLRTPDEVKAQYPGDRTDQIAPVRGGSGPDLAGGGGAGPSASVLGDLDAGAGPEGLTWAYSPGQKRDSVGRFGSGGGKSAPSSGSSRPSTMTAKDANASLMAVGIYSDLADVHERLRPEVVDAMLSAHIRHPGLFEDMKVGIETGPLPMSVIAETRSATYNGVPGKAGYPISGQAQIILNKDVFKTVAIAHQTMADAGRKGWLAGNTVDHAVQHEVGHVFDAALGHTSSTHSGVQSLGSPGKPSPFLEATQAVSNPPVSQYAKQSPAERFAEDFAVVARDGKPTQYADSIIVDQLMRQHG